MDGHSLLMLVSVYIFISMCNSIDFKLSPHDMHIYDWHFQKDGMQKGHFLPFHILMLFSDHICPEHVTFGTLI